MTAGQLKQGDVFTLNGTKMFCLSVDAAVKACTVKGEEIEFKKDTPVQIERLDNTLFLRELYDNATRVKRFDRALLFQAFSERRLK